MKAIILIIVIAILTGTPLICCMVNYGYYEKRREERDAETEEDKSEML